MKTLEDFLFGLLIVLTIFVIGVQCGIYSAHQREEASSGIGANTFHAEHSTK